MELENNSIDKIQTQSENMMIESDSISSFDHLVTKERNVADIVFWQQKALLQQQQIELQHKLDQEKLDNQLGRDEQTKDNHLKRKLLGITVTCSILVQAVFFYFVYYVVTSPTPSDTVKSLLVAISFLAGSSATFLFFEVWKILKKDNK
jgi:hypothetical protein